MKKNGFILSTLLLLCYSFSKNMPQRYEVASKESKSLNLDLDRPEDNMTAFVKVRASLTDNEEVIYYANGKIYGFVDGERDKPLMGFQMYNIGRSIKRAENSYYLLTNEVLLYTDLNTGKVLEEFNNPYTKETVDVVHVWNSPVNQKQDLEGRYGKWGIPHQKLGEDMICMNADIFLKYPSPLTIAEFPENAQSDNYEAAELFQFFFSEKDMNNPDKASIPCTISWTRLGPWLPWLKMGQRSGNMVYQGAGYKLMESDYNKMPKMLIDYVLANHPEYRHAPTKYTQPNETSWTYFKKLNSNK
ncbi:DUF1838 domain-containing protein [Aquimarina sp. RZ0]|nr:DUF1838 domain-containing protein [Aquimarina sp. RZ0]